MSQDGVCRRINADVVRRLREEQMLTQQELAELANVSRLTVINYERGGDRPPKPSHVRRIAEALKADPRDLVTITFD